MSTPGMTAPLLSNTVPPSDALNACACAASGLTLSSDSPRTKKLVVRITAHTFQKPIIDFSISISSYFKG
jgi:hypothetical protein